MDYWKEAYNVADTAFENSWLLWIVYISFFILAWIVRKKENRTRHITGNVMLVVAVPGMLISAGCFGLYTYTLVRVYQVAISNTYRILSESPVVKELEKACNTYPFRCAEFSIILFYVLALTAIICGIVILKKKAGKGIGVVTLIYGIALFALACLYFYAIALFWGS